MQRAGMVERVKKEVEIHCTLRHPSILEVLSYMQIYYYFALQLYSFFEDSEQVYLVLEMCHNGTLNDYIKTTQLQEYEGDVLCNSVRSHVANIKHSSTYLQANCPRLTVSSFTSNCTQRSQLSKPSPYKRHGCC